MSFTEKQKNSDKLYNKRRKGESNNVLTDDFFTKEEGCVSSAFLGI